MYIADISPPAHYKPRFTIHWYDAPSNTIYLYRGSAGRWERSRWQPANVSSNLIDRMLCKIRNIMANDLR
jgi:hypothetical protein